jgi:predicted transcriptional regulator of viral defense system
MDKKAQKGEYLDILLRSKNTVFTTKDISLLWREAQTNATQTRLKSYVRRGKLIRIRRGIYVKDKNYDRYEFATKILRPSYVSFETVLGASGLTFQYYGQIFVASYATRELACDKQKYSFIQMKDSILSNPSGIDQSGEYAIATPERAFLDTIYRSGDYYFDNLSPLDWDKVFALVSVYDNKQMAKIVQKQYEYYKSSK